MDKINITEFSPRWWRASVVISYHTSIFCNAPLCAFNTELCLWKRWKVYLEKSTRLQQEQFTTILSTHQLFVETLLVTLWLLAFSRQFVNFFTHLTDMNDSYGHNTLWQEAPSFVFTHCVKNDCLFIAVNVLHLMAPISHWWRGDSSLLASLLCSRCYGDLLYLLSVSSSRQRSS